MVCGFLIPVSQRLSKLKLTHLLVFRASSMGSLAMFSSRVGLSRYSPLLLRRFLPPWEKDGKTADGFFDGILTSNNPFQQQRKLRRRQEEADDQLDAAIALQQAEQQSQREALDAHFKREAEALAAAQNFLPYGASPCKYFEKDQMAAWGLYQSMLDAQGYNETTQALLRSDADTKIPYRYNECPPLSRNGHKFPLHGTSGFVLDIDGVIYRSKEIIDGSDEAIRQLIKLKIPFVFMTNGGGLTEEERAAQLSRLLQCDILPEQVLMAHTPMQLLAERYRNENVLIIGTPHCADVARKYGFKNAKSILQFQAEHSELCPLKQWPVMGVNPLPPLSCPKPPIAAVFQFADCQDAFNDIQVVVDVLTSPHGQIGSAVSGVQTVPFYFCADDLLWATKAPLPRLGNGAFREMLSSVYESVTGNNLHVTHFGKPRAIAYAFAEKRLREVSAGLGWNPNDMRLISMIGDNLETDVIGANARGEPWLSVHVLSGVGSAPAARRTMSDMDDEMEWLSEHVAKTPHYVAPTFDHYLRELLAFPEEVIVQNRVKSFGMPCPVDLTAVYNFKS